MHPGNVKAFQEQTAAIARAELPPLDLLRSFEAAARHLSFTLAAQEMFLTQSAVSRQIQQVEASLGVPLFERRHRALELTEAGRLMQRAVTDCLERLRDATARVRASSALRQVSMTCTPGFASLWLIPRLVRFTAAHPAVDVRISATVELLDLERSQVDLAVRFCPIADGGGAPLFEESLLPVCAPALAASRDNPLQKPADLARHTLLAVDMPQGMALTVDWEPWTQVMGLSGLRMKNTVRFTQYADAIAAAMEGQGVAIGRLPLLAELLRSGRLVAPFGGGAASQRGYYVRLSERGAANADAQDFARWLRAEAAA
ncbi:LysR substrate-binding domain-containing protein [uncultured Ramlibacter sp.]|uniref:LysR substrate-binding domain-containing protein n=1 Tax=uncultured Ramlibacter sp. TaxID=260755 RepID=UPI0026241CDB|nr:LysR substrate-binding domain-containing protein [uncultured Ramlibacter sp.]